MKMYVSNEYESEHVKVAVSIYNPKHPDYIEMPPVKPEPSVPYGGPLDLSICMKHGGVNPRTVGHVDSHGQYVRCTPKASMKKNTEARQRSKFLIFYEDIEGIDSVICESRKHDEIYFSEYGLVEIKESARYRDEDQNDCVNNRWLRFTKLTKDEEAIIKASRL